MRRKRAVFARGLRGIKAMGTPPPPKFVTRSELAREFDCHPRTIIKWQDHGLPVAVCGKRGRASRYDLAQCRSWRATYERFSGGELYRLASRTHAVSQQRGLAAVQEELEFLASQVLYSVFAHLNGETPVFED